MVRSFSSLECLLMVSSVLDQTDIIDGQHQPGILVPLAMMRWTRLIGILVPCEDQNAGCPVSGLAGQGRQAERPSGPLDVFGNVVGRADSEPNRHHACAQIPRAVASIECGLHGLGRESMDAWWGESGLPAPEVPEALERGQRLRSVSLAPLAAHLDAVEH